MKPSSLEYSREYFFVQVLFAQKWAALSSHPVSKIMRYSTHLAKCVTGVWGIDPVMDHYYPWCVAMHKADHGASTEEIVEHLYNVYLGSKHALWSWLDENDERVGYKYWDYQYSPNDAPHEEKNVVYIHFKNRHRGEHSSLHKKYRQDRDVKLREMMKFIRKRYPRTDVFAGTSWLYNVPAYADHFPDAYQISKAQAVPKTFRKVYYGYPLTLPLFTAAIWGQFINRYGRIHSERAHEFVKNVRSTTQTADLMEAFPLKAYHASLEAKQMYEFFDL